MRSQTFQRAVLTRAAAELGIPGFHPHELRHTAAAWPLPAAPTSRSSSRCWATSRR
jgi:integrase